MNKKFILNSAVIFCISISQLYSQYEVIDAFSNLTFNDPVGIYYAPDGTDRLFVLEQPGEIKVFNNDSDETNIEIFLDIEDIVDQGGGYTEEGLLGLAFHPDFSENGYFYVNYTKYAPRRNVIARYSVSEDNLNQADYQSSMIILEVNQPYSNHNGGQMGFGPDGYLYISFGDGGSGGDPQGNGQDLTTLLGSLIRIDIDNPSYNLNYGIPPDNPFIIPLAARDEIYAYGLRNMWRFSWDSETGFLWGADVGQNSYEEIDIIESGLNYGWNTMEANHCYPPGTECNSEGLEPPVWEYELYVNGECSITGGFVYRGDLLPSLYGKYVYGDWCTGDMWALTYVDSGNHLNEHLLTTDINITSFGLDQNNELLFSGNESIYKFSPEIEILMGDVNYDGVINILDVLQIISYILGNSEFSSEQENLSDLNSDGVINVLDIIQIVNIILN
jgi:glucose/arabinose dehydrogenase